METLEQKVWSEQNLLELLGIERRTLDNLRNAKGFPFIRLTNKSRVYLANDVLDWLESRRIMGQ